MTSFGDGRAAQLHWAQSYAYGDEQSAEYAVDPIVLDLASLWSETDWGYYWYVGDIDGDGVSDLAQRYMYRLSSKSQWFEMPPDWFDEAGERYNPERFSGVGDVDGDGYDDIVIGWRAFDFVYDCAYTWGPAELFLGSSDGLQPTPVWTLWVPGNSEMGVGQQVVAVPEQDALIVTMMRA